MEYNFRAIGILEIDEKMKKRLVVIAIILAMDNILTPFSFVLGDEADIFEIEENIVIENEIGAMDGDGDTEEEAMTDGEDDEESSEEPEVNTGDNEPEPGTNTGDNEPEPGTNTGDNEPEPGTNTGNNWSEPEENTGHVMEE